MAVPASAAAAQPFPQKLRSLAPGLLLCLAIALVAIWLRNLSGIAVLNPVVVALVAGIAIRAALGPMPAIKPGLAFSVRPLLRAAIVLLGLQVTLGQLWALGPGALVLAVVVVFATLPFTVWLGSAMGVDRALSQLIGTGTAICGASAIVAANQVARGKDEDVTYALAVITLCGTVSLILFPYLAELMGMGARSYGLWAGAAIHEVVQAVGAAAAGGPEASQSGTVMKLARVFLLAPAVLALGWWVARSAGGEAGSVKAPVPWFAFGFLGLVVLGSTGLLPAAASDASRFVVPIMLAASVAALGLSTDLKALKARGAAPLMLGVASTVFIAVLALLGVALIG
jgi:uncharacterized integral membrane protein (TIGR00698 family)